MVRQTKSLHSFNYVGFLFAHYGPEQGLSKAKAVSKGLYKTAIMQIAVFYFPNFTLATMSEV